MQDNHPRSDQSHQPLTELKLFVPDDLYRAFQRCVWVLINETDRDQHDIMQEVVRDFLVKHGC